MPATINPIRKARLKRELLKHPKNSIAESLINAGYAEKSARGKSGAMKVVKVCMAEIAQELKHCDITPDLMIKRFEEDRRLAIEKRDYATATRVDELMAKSIAMLVEKTENKTSLVIKPDEISELTRIRNNLIPSIN